VIEGGGGGGASFGFACSILPFQLKQEKKLHCRRVACLHYDANMPKITKKKKANLARRDGWSKGCEGAVPLKDVLTDK
jgi:hypothetical protein